MSTRRSLRVSSSAFLLLVAAPLIAASAIGLKLDTLRESAVNHIHEHERQT